MPGPRRPFQHVLQADDFDEGAKVRRIHHVNGGVEDEVGTAAGALDEVVVEVARVALQILVRPELRGVDEDRDDDEIVVGAGAFDE